MLTIPLISPQLYSVIQADNTLRALFPGNPTPIPFFEFVPENAGYTPGIFPFLSYTLSVADWGDKDIPGDELVLEMHGFDRNGGFKRLNDIMARIYRILHQQESILQAPGLNITILRCTQSIPYRDPDGLTFYRMSRYQIIAQATN